MPTYLVHHGPDLLRLGLPQPHRVVLGVRLLHVVVHSDVDAGQARQQPELAVRPQGRARGARLARLPRPMDGLGGAGLTDREAAFEGHLQAGGGG